MLIVTDLNGNSEMLTDVQGAELNEEINGDYSLSFTVFNTDKNTHSYPLLQEESLVEYNGHEFRVKQLTEIHNHKSVMAQHAFFDLIDHKKDDMFGGTRMIHHVFNWLLSGTGWTFEIVGVVPSQLLANFGNTNVLSLIRSACNIYGCNIKIEKNKHLKIGLRVGTDKDEQFRYKHNIKSLKKTVDTTNLTTCVKGIGGDGLEVIFKSPNVSIYGERWAEDVSDERFTNATTFTEYIKTKIQDIPEISIDIEVITLGMDVSLDDGVWTIYEPLGLEYLSYVTSIKSYPFTNKSSVVTISNVKKTITDILTQTKIEIDENKKQTESKFEQTNEKISMEVTRLDGDIEEAKAQIEVTADEIRAEVTEQIDDVNSSISSLSIQASNISLSVSSLQGTVNNHTSTLSVLSSQISSKVSQTDFNGNTITSLINQTASTVKIQASKIELAGVVTTNDIQIGNSLRLGNSNWSSTKKLIFNDAVWIEGIGDRLTLSTTGGINFMSYTSFHNTVDFREANILGLSTTAKFG